MAPVRGRFGSRTSSGIFQNMQSWTIGVTKLKFQNSAYAVVQKHHRLKFNREYLQVQADGPLHPEENLLVNNIEVSEVTSESKAAVKIEEKHLSKIGKNDAKEVTPEIDANEVPPHPNEVTQQPFRWLSNTYL